MKTFKRISQWHYDRSTNQISGLVGGEYVAAGPVSCALKESEDSYIIEAGGDFYLLDPPRKIDFKESNGNQA